MSTSNRFDTPSIYHTHLPSVYPADEIGAFVTQITSDPELTGQEEVVRLEEFPRLRKRWPAA
jgi:hypothetical protein